MPCLPRPKYRSTDVCLQKYVEGSQNHCKKPNRPDKKGCCSPSPYNKNGVTRDYNLIVDVDLQLFALEREFSESVIKPAVKRPLNELEIDFADF